ncbi:MAG: GatB/YqeY domain-containing protein [Candidatus Berkelbacteria bacterium]|nr:GatB/YqeY domain-containing protein [Candidatus Berkelbacteria bacterium]
MLKEQIEQNLIDAMKSHDDNTVSVLRMLKSAVKNGEIQKQKEFDDSDTTGVIQSQIKSRRDSIDLYKKGNRPELAEKEQAEIDILVKYLPEQMDENAVREIVKKAIADTGASSIQDMGKVMGKLMPEVKGQADGSMVSNIVKEELSKAK